MRIIAGKHRGRILSAFKGEEVRPTSDRVKESVFQILSPRIPGARVLDLFCGSGALGIECLSRGAAAVQFNDLSRDSLALLRKNLSLVREEGKISNLDFRTCLASAVGTFDLILCDPPYRMLLCPEILALVRERGLLSRDGILVYEGEREEFPTDGFVRTDFRSYGRTAVCFFQRSQV